MLHQGRRRSERTTNSKGPRSVRLHVKIRRNRRHHPRNQRRTNARPEKSDQDGLTKTSGKSVNARTPSLSSKVQQAILTSMIVNEDSVMRTTSGEREWLRMKCDGEERRRQQPVSSERSAPASYSTRSTRPERIKPATAHILRNDHHQQSVGLHLHANRLHART